MADNVPKVSVIISTYNRAEYLSRSIGSVFRQTYENYELIVVDDASNDNTSDVVADFGDKRIRYIKHDKNKGGPAARNTGIKSAKGEYIALLDDDDEWMAEKLELQVRHMEEVSDRVGVIYCGSEIREEPEDKLIEIYFPDYAGDLRYHLLSGPVIGGVSKVLLRRRCFEKAGLFDENLKSCQDWDMWLRISEHYRFDFVPKVLVVTYLHPGQISDDFRQLIPGRTRMVRKHMELFKKHPEELVVHLKRLGKLNFINGTWKEGAYWFKRALSIYPLEIFKIIAWCMLELPKVKYLSRQGRFIKYIDKKK